MMVWSKSFFVMVNDKSNKSDQFKPYTAEDAKRRIEEEKKRDPEAFKKKYGGKMPPVQK